MPSQQAAPAAATSPSGGYAPWTPYLGVKIVRKTDESAYAFQLSSFAIDADGAPNAYHPDDIGKGSSPKGVYKGLDNPSNAGYPNVDPTKWNDIIVQDPKDSTTGYIQPVGSPCPGFFVSQTSLHDKTKSVLDPSRYVDATEVPYFVFPGEFLRTPGTGGLGDFGVAKNSDTGALSPFVVADTGGKTARLGEMSIALAQALGGTKPNPRTGTGTPPGTVVFILFPHSATTPAWPVPQAQLQALATQLLQAAGGFESLAGIQL